MIYLYTGYLCTGITRATVIITLRRVERVAVLVGSIQNGGAPLLEGSPPSIKNTAQKVNMTP